MTRCDVLRLDIKGSPQEWISQNEAAKYYATDDVAWTIGDAFATLRGGTNAISGELSTIDIHPIIAVNGSSRVNLFDFVPSLTNRKLFARDRLQCCYCGKTGDEKSMTREHIIPTSKGGKDNWLNCACCCKSCNSLKADKNLQQSGFKLLYAPYTPSLFEDFILSGRHIRADVHDFLAAKLPRGSRLL